MYLWYKALHLIFMVAWFAGLFYIFRLFVYHVQHREQAALAEAYARMEYRLMYFIMHPAMTGTLLFGILMLVEQPTWLKQGWLHGKLLGIVGLMAYQFYGAYVRRKMAKGIYPLSERACRIINEVPTVLLIVIVLLAVLKP